MCPVDVILQDEDGVDRVYQNVTADELELADHSGWVKFYYPEGTLNIVQNGTYDVAGKASVEVDVPTSGGTVLASNDVNFYDYDGSIVYAFSKDDFLALSAMPTNPTHEGLTAQGWNWTLAGAKAYVTAYGILDIGQMYASSDGATHLFIRVDEDGPFDREIVFDEKVTDGVTLNWGDGTVETFTYDHAKIYARHTYAQSGSYEIKLDVSADVTIELHTFMWGLLENGYWAGLYKAIIGERVILGNTNACLSYNPDLTSLALPCGTPFNAPVVSSTRIKHLTLPTTISSASGSFSSSLDSICLPEASPPMTYAPNVRRLCLPVSQTTIPQQFAYSSRSFLSEIVIPDSVESIGNLAFYYCASLKKITIPQATTSIGNSAFSSCYSLVSVTVLRSTPATLGTNVFQGCSKLQYIYVPAESVTAYKSAAGWSTYASKIQAITS